MSRNVPKINMAYIGGGIFGWTGAPRKRMLGRHHVSDTYLSLITTVPPILGKDIPSNNIRFIEVENIDWYLEGLFNEGEWYYDWPTSYKVPEQHHIWEIPQGKVMFHELLSACVLIILLADTPLPDGLHLRMEPCPVPGCKRRGTQCKLCLETDSMLIYNLHISKSMALSAKLIQL